MRCIAIAAAGLLLASIVAYAQSDEPFEAETEHYTVVSHVDEQHARTTADRLEATLEIFNDYFHFDLSESEEPMRVRVFATEDQYREHLEDIIEEPRDDFVYLHYGDPARNELVGYHHEDPEYEYSLNHQAFVQFLRTFVANPPLWLREGFAVYFEEIAYEPETGQAVLEENLAWLGTLRTIVAGESEEPAIPLEDMLHLDVETARRRIEVFYPQAWGMVAFLLESNDRKANRVIWDALSALEPDASMQQNARAIEREALRWVEEDRLIASFEEYLGERRSFRDLVENGISAYEEEDTEAAEEAFVRALRLRRDNHVPNYYLGLINYDRRRHGLGEYYYREALETGAEEALVYYALGVNAYADNRFDDAIDYLERTIELAPDRYGAEAEELLRRMDD
ncbi:MAG: tetratricopeptide repeat protein [Spirochaetaceae bacterium]